MRTWIRVAGFRHPLPIAELLFRLDCAFLEAEAEDREDAEDAAFWRALAAP